MFPKLLLLIGSLFAITQAHAWGQKGHDVTAYIAEQHLTNNVAKKIDKLLDGHSLVYYANWLDHASHTEEYAYTKTWHYRNVDEGKTLNSLPLNPEGDVVQAINELVAQLKFRTLPAEKEQVYLKMLIHLVGDLHCPMHLGRLTDLGGNRLPVSIFGKPSNLHSVWDTAIPEAIHKWSYTEWQQQIDRADEEKITHIVAGTPYSWAEETWTLCCEIYDFTPEGTKISYDYLNKYAPIVEQQFLRGGLRLAHLLNEIYK